MYDLLIGKHVRKLKKAHPISSDFIRLRWSYYANAYMYKHMHNIPIFVSVRTRRGKGECHVVLFLVFPYYGSLQENPIS